MGQVCMGQVGQVCGHHICDQVDLNPHAVEHMRPSDDTAKRIEQLAAELRMLKDSNYRLREEHLELQRALSDAQYGRRSRDRGGAAGGASDAAGGPWRFPRVPSASCADPRVDIDQQVLYMQQMVRKLQEENRLLHRSAVEGTGVSSASETVAGGTVGQEEFRALRTRVAHMQQQHLQHLQEARHLKSLATSAPTSGRSTPVSTGGGLLSATASAMGSTPGVSADGRSMQAQYDALTREQEELRAKIRRLAANT